MRLGIIGPTHWQENCKLIGISEKAFLAQTKKIVPIVKALGFDIVVNTHKNGIYYFFAKEFKSLGGKVFGVVPLQDKEFGIDYLDQSVCTEVIDCGTWREMAVCLNEKCDAFLCLGYSPGMLNEIAFSKWFNAEKDKRKKILVVKEFVSARLPKESIKGLNVEYIALKNIEKELKKLF